MTLLTKKRNLIYLFAAMIGLVILMISPMLMQLFSKSFFNTPVNSSEEWSLPFLRTILFSICTVTLQILLGFFIAIRLYKIKGKLNWAYGFLLIPSIIGDVIVGFLFKMDIISSNFVIAIISNREFLPTWGMMATIQSWQYVPLFAYFFWLRLITIPQNITSFAISSSLSSSESTKDIFWPQCRNVAIILALFSFVKCYGEFIKFDLILKASQGTGTELVSHWLLRFFSFFNPIDPRLAITNTLAMGIIFTLLGLVFAIIYIFLVNKHSITLIGKFSKFISFGLDNHYSNWIITIFSLLISIYPFSALVPYIFRGSFIELDGFIRASILTFIATLFATGFAVIFGYIARISWAHFLEKFNRKSSLIFSGLFLLHFVPPLCIALSGYYWLSILEFNVQNEFFMIITWGLAQILLALPVLIIFILLIHFRLRNDELNFQINARADLKEIFNFSFFSRFKLDYSLIFLFGFSFIWNESTLNSIMSNLSRNIPSIAVELTQRIDGRGGSYFEAANLIAVILIPILIGLIIWGILLKKNKIIY